MEHDKYTYRVTWSEEDMEYVGLCTEFPSLSWLAGHPEDALRGIREVVGAAVADMLDNDEKVPVPLSTRRFSGKFLVRIPPELHRQLAFGSSRGWHQLE